MKITSSIFGKTRIITLVSACFLLVASIACKDKKQTAADTLNDFQMNCVRLTSQQVQVWVDSGWTKPENADRIRALLFQFYSESGAQAAENMQLTVYPGKNWSNVKAEGRANLSIDTTCVALKPSGKTIFANNVVDIRALNILKPDGTLKDFDFIRFRPVQKGDEYIVFEVEVVKVIEEKETYLFKGDTYPCPPHCPPVETES